MIHVFIDTSSLPRGLNKLTPEIERLIELVEVDLVRIHISVVAAREWESQIVKESVKCVEAVSKSVEDLRRQSFSEELSFREKLNTLASKREDMRSEAKRVAKKRVEDLFTRLKAEQIDVAPEDGADVRSDSFHVDDWVNVSFPDDFEANHYFEAQGYRCARVSGWISLHFTLEELQADQIKVPDFDLDDIEIHLTDNKSRRHGSAIAARLMAACCNAVTTSEPNRLQASSPIRPLLKDRWREPKPLT